mgnify:CR=1 FL=1
MELFDNRTLALANIIKAQIHSVRVISGILIESVRVQYDEFCIEIIGLYDIISLIIDSDMRLNEVSHQNRDFCRKKIDIGSVSKGIISFII